MSFRAFHLPSQRMFVVGWFDEYDIYERPRPGYLASPQPLRAYPIGECVLMQYSGVLDRQGVGVYEGDILRLDHIGTCRASSPSYARYYRVIFHNGGFCSMGIEDTDPDQSELYYFSDTGPMLYELIVGNIYETPELLQRTGYQLLVTPEQKTPASLQRQLSIK